MDSMPLHPALVHIPLGLALGAPFLMTGMAVAFRRGRLARSAWSIAVCLQALVFAGGLWAMNAGHAEEERVEEIVAERYIHEHEERAEAFVWAAGVTLLLTASVLVLKESMALQAAAVASVAAFVTLGMAYRAGVSGGELVYKHGAASAYAEPASQGAEDDEEDEEDEEDDSAGSPAEENEH